MADKIRSIQDRLRNTARKLKLDFTFILRLYFHERILYRLSVSKYKSSFILKGGLLLSVFNISSFRPTKDIDLLGKNMKLVLAFMQFIASPFALYGGLICRLMLQAVYLRAFI